MYHRVGVLVGELSSSRSCATAVEDASGSDGGPRDSILDRKKAAMVVELFMDRYYLIVRLE